MGAWAPTELDDPEPRRRPPSPPCSTGSSSRPSWAASCCAACCPAPRACARATPTTRGSPRCCRRGREGDDRGRAGRGPGRRGGRAPPARRLDALHGDADEVVVLVPSGAGAAGPARAVAEAIAARSPRGGRGHQRGARDARRAPRRLPGGGGRGAGRRGVVPALGRVAEWARLGAYRLLVRAAADEQRRPRRSSTRDWRPCWTARSCWPRSRSTWRPPAAPPRAPSDWASTAPRSTTGCRGSRR